MISLYKVKVGLNEDGNNFLNHNYLTVVAKSVKEAMKRVEREINKEEFITEVFLVSKIDLL